MPVTYISKYQIMLTILIALVGFAIDRIAKILTLTYVKPEGSVDFIPGFMDFAYVENRGAAHGILQGMVVPLTIGTGIVCILIIIFLIKNYGRASALLRVALGLILAGAFGNMFDRIFYGYVVDMMHVLFIEYPVFNPADNMLVVGTVLLGLYIIFFDKVFLVSKDKKEAPPEEDGKNEEQ